MKSLCILLVDDDLLLGSMLAEMIDGTGHSVCGVEATEAAAVKAALLGRPDLMIVDVRLGKRNGIAAVERIWQTIQIPHIFMSGERLYPDQGSAIMLLKPFTLRDLSQAIEKTLRKWTAS